ncbi:PIR Superfamily Protein [Plasmodium ovale curtisi]|uniref:PIR Superfamily Protein n=1 Tax=Plasmodium ovale curtisi TaxID=864141 RepID=A0A1A8XCN3_PLAOA|nr:PIR Superfamily Protein [Plasmodium ovale curtisi]
MSSEIDYKKILNLFGYSSKELFSERFYDALNNDYSSLIKYRSHCNAVVFPKNRNHINKAFGSLQYIWHYIITDKKEKSYYNKCKPLFEEILNYNDWKQRKQLYDYYVDYDTLFNTAINYRDERCTEYYKKIEEKKPLYDYFKKECESEEYKCPEFYKNYKQYNPDTVLPKLPCYNEMLADKKYLAEQEGLSRKQEEGTPSAQVSDIQLTRENSDIGTKVSHTVLGVAPVLLTATALYRYTPIGSWIRNFGGKSTNRIYNMDGGEMEGFLGNTQESGDMFFRSGENYISYTPM